MISHPKKTSKKVGPCGGLYKNQIFVSLFVEIDSNYLLKWISIEVSRTKFRIFLLWCMFQARWLIRCQTIILPLKSYLPLFATFFRNMKSCQNMTRFDLGRLFAMHITQKNSEVRHSILHVDLIPITRLVGYLVLQLEKSDSKEYLSVFFFPKKIKNLQNFLDVCVAWPREVVLSKARI